MKLKSLNHPIDLFNRNWALALSVVMISASATQSQETFPEVSSIPIDKKGAELHEERYLRSPIASDWPEIVAKAGGLIQRDGRTILSDTRFRESSNLVAVGESRVAFCFGDILSLWDIVQGKEVWRYSRPAKAGHTRNFEGNWQLASHPDGSRLYTAFDAKSDRDGNDHKFNSYSDFETTRGLAVWDVQSGEQVAHLEPDSRLHRLVNPQLSADGQLLIAPQISFKRSGSSIERDGCKSVVLFDTATNKRIKTITFTSNSYVREGVHVFLHPVTKTIAAVQSDPDYGRTRNFVVDTYSIESDKNIPKRVVLPCGLNGETSDLVDLAVDPTGRFIATRHGHPDFVALRDSRTFSELRRWLIESVDESSWPSMSFDPYGERLLLTKWERWNGPSYVINTTSGEFSFGLPCHRCIFARNGSRVAGFSSRSVLLGDANDGRLLGKIVQPVVPRSSILMSAEQRLSATEDLVLLINRYADSAKNSQGNMSVTVMSRFFKEHNNPYLVYADINGVKAEYAPNLKASYRIPEISIGEPLLQGGRLKFHVKAQSCGDGIGVEQISVRIAENRNHQDALNFTLSENGQDSLGQTVELSLPSGLDTVTVVATVRDQVGGEGIPVWLRVKTDSFNTTKAGNRLFVLSIGVSNHAIKDFNLAYAASDATEVANSLRKLEGVGFSSVVTQVITDEKASLENIRKGMQWLQTSCQPNDTVLIFISGHGIRGRRGLYYLPHEGDPESIQSSCLNWEELSTLLSGLKTSSILCLTDVCHAGAIGETSLEMQKEAADALKRNQRAIIGASSQGNQFSLELDSLKHGVFAAALCEAFAGKADENQDGALTYLELENYCTTRVLQLTDGKQRPKFVYESDTVGKSTFSKLVKGERRLLVIKATPVLRGSEQVAAVEPGNSILVERQENGWSLGTIDVGGKKIKGWVRSADLQVK